MATARKLPSGSWRCQVYSHSEKIWDEKKGTWKEKRIYQSFTSDDPTRAGKSEAEMAAAEFLLTRSQRSLKTVNLTLEDAIQKYIAASSKALSGTTIQGYTKKQYDSYEFLMGKRLRDITADDLQEAINLDCQRPSKISTKNPKTISPKTVKNTYGFISSVIHYYLPDAVYNVKLPTVPVKVKELLPPEVIIEVLRGTDIELPCLLAMWLSLTMSELRGIKYKDIQDGCLRLDRVVVDIGNTPTVKESGKTSTRLRMHKLPEYILSLIPPGEPEDFLITASGSAIYKAWKKLLKKNQLPDMTFHDLRHENASIMQYLNIPDKYAMERGGWKTDRVMKKVYVHTFSKGRQEADNAVNQFFDQMLDISSDFDKKKYQAWLTLNDAEDAPESRENFLKYMESMQHEMQHEAKKVP